MIITTVDIFFTIKNLLVLGKQKDYKKLYYMDLVTMVTITQTWKVLARTVIYINTYPWFIVGSCFMRQSILYCRRALLCTTSSTMRCSLILNKIFLCISSSFFMCSNLCMYNKKSSYVSVCLVYYLQKEYHRLRLLSAYGWLYQLLGAYVMFFKATLC